MTTEFPRGSTPVVKDPRICRLMGLWKPVFDKLAPKSVCPFIIRDPLEVADSLVARDSMERDQGLLLWARYYLDAEYQTRGLPRAFIAYDELLRDPRRVLGSLQALLDLQLEEGQAADLSQFVTADLRHNRRSEGESLRALERMPLLADAHRVLGRWARGDQQAADEQILDQARAELDRSGAILDDVLERARMEAKRRLILKSASDATSADLDRARRALEDVSGVKLALKNVSEEVRQRLAKLIQERDEARVTLAGIRQERDAASIRIGELKVARDDARSRAAELKEARDEARARVGELKQARDEAQQARDDARLSAKEARSERDKARQRIGEMKDAVAAAVAAHRAERRAREVRDEQIRAQTAEKSALKQQLKTVTGKYRSTQQILAREREQLKQLKRRIAQLDHELEGYRQSLLWRAYVRLARAGRQARGALLAPFGGSKRRRRSRALQLLRSSSYFDAAWYLDRYPDVAAGEVDPATHYLESGWREGRDPGPTFSTSAYLKSNADVAALGINPLLHYIEYGRSEGRGEPQKAKLKAIPQAKFAPFSDPAPVHAGSTGEPAGEWVRASALTLAGNADVSVNGFALAKTTCAADRGGIAAALDAFEQFSSGQSCDAAAIFAPSPPTSMIDGWHAGEGMLRTRWQPGSAGGLVVRAVQASPEGLRLIGEGLAATATDIVEIRPHNALFPIFFVFARPDGDLAGWDMLPFPSLLRGGAHELEAVLAAQRSGDSVATLGRRCAEALLGQAEQGPLVGTVQVDLADANGTEQLFRADIQQWLVEVIGVAIEPIAGERPATSQWLAAAARLSASRKRADGGATLGLRADMLPSIASLTAAGQGSDGPGAALPFVATTASLNGGIWFGVPGDMMDAAVAAFPSIDRAVPDDARIDVAAVRQSNLHQLNDAQLLAPVSPPLLRPSGSDQAISWIVAPEAWDEQCLLESLEALALQQGGPASLVLVGSSPPEVDRLAGRLFPERVTRCVAAEDAAQAITTPLAGYMGPNVLLHDSCTAALMAGLLDSGASSASVPLLRIGKPGNPDAVALADAGHVPARSGPATGSLPLELLWRAHWPVAAPPRDLWLAPTDIIKAWSSGEPALPPSTHICSAVVTASYNGDRRDSPPLIAPPVADENAMQHEVVVA
ncbi:MAG TPA: hypothetical protein VIL42_03965 [Sphingomicrobium sp.]|jgi:hypothetical protein